ncbi:DsbA family protein [Saccharothrix sp. HUAS TT1]|uniref:DsbA family oxidoreductase n=1 Tax=unclassified Saccharothrix TaxID=2593673 RepID=UPI00345C43B6
MTVQVVVYSDYVCPYCLLAEGIVEQAVAGKDAEVVWRPFELRPEPTPTLRPEDDYLPAVWRQSVYPMARRLGVPIVLPSVSPQPYTHTAFEGFCFAEDHGRGAEYTAAVFRAFFQDERNIGEHDVLTDIAESIGLDGAAFRAALEDRRYRDRHREALRQAARDEVSAVPTILVGNRRISGVPDPDALTALVDEAIAARSASASH